MLHPDKTKILFFSTNSNGEGVQIICNSNNDNLANPALIKPLEIISSKDDIPAAKFLGVYFDSSLSFKYQTRSLALRKNYLKPFTFCEW